MGACPFAAHATRHHIHRTAVSDAPTATATDDLAATAAATATAATDTDGGAAW